MSDASPIAMTLGDLAEWLSYAAGKTITEKMLRADIAAGAPVNPDGTFHALHYMAWLLQERKRGR